MNYTFHILFFVLVPTVFCYPKLACLFYIKTYQPIFRELPVCGFAFDNLVITGVNVKITLFAVS
jgi:hypothetical protein